MSTTRTQTPVPTRLLLGSGPSIVPDSVLAALAQPTIGHMDPAFAAIMGETIDLLREAFQTENTATLAVSGTGSAGMEAMVVNFVNPGDRVVCGVHGLFGARMADELARNGAEVIKVEARVGPRDRTRAAHRRRGRRPGRDVRRPWRDLDRRRAAAGWARRRLPRARRAAAHRLRHVDRRP